MNTRCKFKCIAITEREGGVKDLELIPVIDGSAENKEFWKWTPSGSIKIGCANPNVKFEVGKEYYVDFTLV